VLATTTASYLEALNPEQRRAVEHGSSGGQATSPWRLPGLVLKWTSHGRHFRLGSTRSPALVFQAKWATEAEDIGFGWAQDHAQQISTKGPHGTDLPAVIKVRVARRDEKAAYEAESGNVDIYAGVKIILVELA
jgi:hypothetical protein